MRAALLLSLARVSRIPGEARKAWCLLHNVAAEGFFDLAGVGLAPGGGLCVVGPRAAVAHDGDAPGAGVCAAAAHVGVEPDALVRDAVGGEAIARGAGGPGEVGAPVADATLLRVSALARELEAAARRDLTIIRSLEFDVHIGRV